MKPQQETPHIDVTDTLAATQALRRAAEMARKMAIDTNTCLVVMEHGNIVRIPAEQLRQQQERK